MKKSLLYRLFGIGGIPKKARPALEAEGIVVADEGVGGWFVMRNVKGPGRRHRQRWEGFTGWLAVTNKRLVCYTFWKRQMNIAVDDPRIAELYVDVPKPDTLSISFEAGVFREGWSGVMEFRFNTEKAEQFRDTLTSLGAQPGTAPEA